MTAKEKAKELIDLYIEIMPHLHNQTGQKIKDHAKECALIAVEQILNEDLRVSPYEWKTGNPYHFWIEVKTLIIAS
jgi:hypothetical protein